MQIKREKSKVHINYDWMELTSLYRKVVADPSLVNSPRMEQLLGEWTEEASWVGATTKEIVDRLENGYEFKNTINPEALPSVAYDRPRPRHTDDPEGEFNYDLYVQGETEHFLSRPKRKMLGGIRLKCQMDFNSNVNSDTIAEYGQWIGSVIQSLQARGYDLEISMFSSITRAYSQYQSSYTGIRVSKFGERVMPFDWSSMFSPGGYRHFFFLSYVWPDEVTKDLRIAMDYGRAISRAWNIEWNPKEREIVVTNNSNASSFPADDMTKRFESWTE